MVGELVDSLTGEGCQVVRHLRHVSERWWSENWIYPRGRVCEADVDHEREISVFSN